MSFGKAWNNAIFGTIFKVMILNFIVIILLFIFFTLKIILS